MSNAFKILPGNLENGLLLICDHASNTIPEGYNNLGLSGQQLGRHIAYDIGAASVVRYLSDMLDVPAVICEFSRLFIDPNRSNDDPTLIMRISDGDIIPGNAEIDAMEVKKRCNLWHEPYHSAIASAIDTAVDSGFAPVLLSIHSFTPVWKGRYRIWDAAVLWDKDPRLARPLIAALASIPSMEIGENEPYSGELEGDCMNRHGTKRGLAHALVEIRQNEIDTPVKQQKWAEILAKIMQDVLRQPDLSPGNHTILAS
jgi:predicted N-formylglutamate amidohydrolase